MLNPFFRKNIIDIQILGNKGCTGMTQVGSKQAISIRVVLAIAVLFIVILAVGCGVLENQNLSLKNQKATLQNQVAAKTSTLDNLNSEVSSMNATIASLQSQVAAMNASNTGLQKKLTSEETLQAQTQAAQSNSQQNLETAQAALTTDQHSLVVDEAQISDLSQQVSYLENDVSALDESMHITGFSIVQITDTQYLPQYDTSLFNGLTSWIVNNSKNLNVMMVVHTGDIVNIANRPAQWENASNAMMTLYNNGIPYCWNCGNHDQLLPNGTMIGDGNPDSGWLGGNYPAFNVTIMRQEPYWVADIFDGTSTAVKFSFANYHFMIINVEYNANQTVLDWMQTLINTNPNANIIVATHNFLNGNGTYGTRNKADVVWATNFQKILKTDPNVFMTLNGHDTDYAPAYNMKVGNKEEIFFNRQELDNQTGAATARIYTFDMSDPANPNVLVSTYQTYGTPHYLVDSADQFNFASSLIPYVNSTVSVPAGTDFLGASGYSMSFAASATLQNFSQNGDALTFTGLTLNDATSSFTASTVGANIIINNFNSTLISYTVSGNGTQTFSVNAAPLSVNIDGAAATIGDGWNYSNGQVTVTAATSEVDINLS